MQTGVNGLGRRCRGGVRQAAGPVRRNRARPAPSHRPGAYAAVMDEKRTGVGSDPLAHINVSRLRSDLRAVRSLGTSSGAMQACTVSADIRQAYGTALRARDEAA